MLPWIRRVLLVLASVTVTVVSICGAPTPAGAAPTVEQVTFRSDGVDIVGLHYRAGGTGPHPVLVMALGLGSTQDRILPEVAPEFTDAGYDVLSFDYRYWGRSAGMPRNLIDVPSQLVDWRAAIAVAKTLPGVDPNAVGIWGSSLSGGHVLQIGSENIAGVRAVIAQAPHVNGVATVSTIPVPTLAQLTALGTADAAGALIGQPPIYLPTAGEPGSVSLLPEPGALAGYARVLGPDFDNRSTARTALQIPFYSPEFVAPLSRSATFVATGVADNITPPTVARALASRMGAEGRDYPGGHFDVYPGGLAYPQLIADEIDFLHRHLPRR